MISIRTVTENDLDDLIKIAKNGEPGILANNKMIYYLATTLLMDYVFVCQEGKKMIGFVFGILNTQKDKLWIHQLVILNDFRGKGYGKKLLTHIEKKAYQNNIKIIELMVRPENNARFLYEKLGYQKGLLNKDTGMLTYHKSMLL